MTDYQSKDGRTTYCGNTIERNEMYVKPMKIDYTLKLILELVGGFLISIFFLIFLMFLINRYG